MSLLPMVERIIAEAIKLHGEEDDGSTKTKDCTNSARNLAQRISDIRSHLTDLPHHALSIEDVDAKRDGAKRRLKRAEQAQEHVMKLKKRGSFARKGEEK